jgi:hypothetical protein
VREPECHAEAKIVLRGQEDVAAAARCLTIASLDIRTGLALDLAPLAKLHVILGELRVGPSVGFIQLDLPELYSAGSITCVGNGDLHGIALPKLASAGDVMIESNVALTTITMPRLAKAASISVKGHAELGLVELSQLVTVDGELSIQDNPKLTLLELGKLERAGSVHVENNGELDPSIVDAVRSKIAP